jgi:hypothetical protein
MDGVAPNPLDVDPARTRERGYESHPSHSTGHFASVRRAASFRSDYVAGTTMTQSPTGSGRQTRVSKNSKKLAEARAATSQRRSASRLGADPYDVIQETLDGLVQDLRFTQKMVDALPEGDLWRETLMSGRIPNEWIRLRDDYRDRAAALAGSMITRGIAEKAVNVRAAQAALMATMVKEAMRRAGLPQEAIAAVGNELRQLAEEAQAG